MRVVATYGIGGDLRRLRVRRAAARRRGRSRWPPTGGSGSAGPTLFDGLPRRPDRRPRRRWSTAGSSPPTPAGSTRTAGCRCSAGSTTWWSAAGSTCRRPRSPPGCASTPRCAAAEVVGVPDAEWGNRVGRASLVEPVGTLALDEARDWVGRRHPRAWAPRERGRRTALPMLANGKVDRLAVRELAGAGPMRVFSIPMRTRFRGITVREGVLLEGDAGLGRVEPVPGVRRPEVAEPWLRLRRGGRRRRLARRRCATACRSTSRSRSSRPRRRTRSCARSGCATAKVKVAEPGQTLADDLARRRGGPRRARAGRAGSASTPTARGTSTTAVAAIARARPGRGRPGVRRAALRRRSRTSPPYAAGSPSRSPPTSRSAGPPTPTACATSRRPTSRCSRCSRSAGCAPACGSPRTSGCRSWSRPRWRPRSASRPGVALAAALPELDHACGLATRCAADRRRRDARAACRSTARCPSSGPPSYPRALDAVGRAAGPGRRGGRTGWRRSGPCGRIATRDVVDRARAVPSSAAWSRAGSARSCSRRARATRRWRSRRTTRPRPGWSGCTPGSTSGRPASSPSG